MALTNTQSVEAIAANPVVLTQPVAALRALGGGHSHPPSFGQGAPSVENLMGMFDNNLQDSKELKKIIINYVQKGAGNTPSMYLANGEWANGVRDTINQYSDTFNSMFRDKVGRDPSIDEINTFFKSVVAPDQPWAIARDPSTYGEKTKSALSDFFTSAAQEQVQKKAQDAATAAVAPGSAFDQWANSYRTSISGVEQSLQDFQSKLMEKIRPQLLTSLQSQGLLNTGGLNEAFAGTAGDLTSAAQNYVANARSGAEQDIANQKFNLLSLPYQQQQQYTMGQIPNLASSGQNALQNVWNQNAMTQQFNQQNQLLDRQMGNQPSLLQQYGGMILGGIAGGAGQGLGKKLGGF